MLLLSLYSVSSIIQTESFCLFQVKMFHLALKMKVSNSRYNSINSLFLGFLPYLLMSCKSQFEPIVLTETLKNNLQSPKTCFSFEKCNVTILKANTFLVHKFEVVCLYGPETWHLAWNTARQYFLSNKVKSAMVSWICKHEGLVVQWIKYCGLFCKINMSYNYWIFHWRYLEFDNTCGRLLTNFILGL